MQLIASLCRSLVSSKRKKKIRSWVTCRWLMVTSMQKQQNRNAMLHSSIMYKTISTLYWQWVRQEMHSEQGKWDSITQLTPLIRCRKLPSLVNCCTIDWYNPWPKPALLSVSKKLLSNVDGLDCDQKSLLSELCVEIHQSVAEAADRFYQELRRRYYTSPKSYLDLIQLYITLLHEKRQDSTSLP